MELQSAVERLYTDESLAADVDDATAKPLLSWAEGLLPGVIAKYGDDGFDEGFVTLKKLVKSVARLIDMRAEMDEGERNERLEKIQAFAQDLGVIIDLSQVENLLTATGPAIVAQLVTRADAHLLMSAVSPEQSQESDAPARMQEPEVAASQGEPESTGHPNIDVTTPQVEEHPAAPANGLQSLFRRFVERLTEQPSVEEPDDASHKE